MSEGKFRLVVGVAALLASASICCYMFVFVPHQHELAVDEAHAKSIQILEKLKDCLVSVDNMEMSMWRDECEKRHQDPLASCTLPDAASTPIDREVASKKQFCYKQADLQAAIEK